MRRSVSGLAFLLAVSWLASAVAQTPGTPGGGVVLKPASEASGHGISNAAVLDQSGARVLRVDVEPNGVRNVHTHDKVDFHLFIPISGTVRLEVDGKPLELRPWQAQYIKGGTKHGFANTGSTTATVMEVFVTK
jgi:quercetin dioxygenase-like cupin family protein